MTRRTGISHISAGFIAVLVGYTSSAAIVFSAANAAGAEINVDDNVINNFLAEMKNTAADWGPDVAQEVEAKLREGLASKVAQGVGSTASFIVPTTGALKIAKIAGASPKVMSNLARVLPGVLGAAQNAQSGR